MKTKLKLKNIYFNGRNSSSISFYFFNGDQHTIDSYFDNEGQAVFKCYINTDLRLQFYSLEELKENINIYHQHLFDKFIDENVTMEVDNE